MNLGAGAVVKQDLTRIDEAVASGESRRRTRCCGRRSTGADRVHLIGLVSDGGVHSGWRHLEALIRLAASLGVRRSGPARVHRRPRHAARVGRRLPRDRAGLDGRRRRRADRLGRGSVLGDGPRPALGPRPARLRPARARPCRPPCCVRGRGGARGLRARRDRRVHRADASRRASGADARIRPDDSVFAFNFRPDRMREITRALAEPGFSRDRPRRRAGGRAVRDDDPVRGGLAVPGGVRARAPCRHAAARARRSGRSPAPRRRDREVRARHVLLRRRARRPRTRASAASSSTRPATSPPTTRSRR